MMHSNHRPFVAFFRWILLSSLLWAVVLGVLAAIMLQPGCACYPASQQTVSPDRLRDHVNVLAFENAPRHYLKLWNLDACARYISDHFVKAGARVSEQRFKTEGNSQSAEQVRKNTYRNIIASFGPDNGSRIVVGAHYDTCGETPGADDNASGVAGLIELAYLLGRTELKQRVDLVAYTLEEPPFFGSSDMGSARHARSLQEEGVDVEAMICLEMIGYFNDEKGSQDCPSFLLKAITPDRANFIAVVGGFGDRKLLRQVKAVMRGATDLPVHAMCAIRSLAGIDLSDHRNYWAHDYTAIMVTDTSFFRNRNYHQLSDTPDTLDYKRMSKVVLGVYEAVVHLANEVD